MMHGYGFAPLGGYGMHSSFGFEGLLIPVGFGLLIVLGVVLWYALSNRNHAYHHAGAYTAQPTVPPVAPTVPGAPAPVDPAEFITRERFARGEIDKDEYDRIVATLRGQ